MMIPALGKLPATVDPRTLRLENYLDKATLPPAPVSVDNTSAVTAWGDLSNTIVGNCVPVYGMHQDMLWTAMAGKPVVYTDSEAVGLYTALTGWLPADGGQGPGVDPLAFYNYWRTVGITGRLLGAFTTVGPGWAQTAISLFGGIGVGLELPLIWRVPDPPFVWDLPEGTGLPLTGQWVPGSWGQHMVLVCGYNALGVLLISWGRVYTMTWRAWNTFTVSGEVYCAIAKDMLGPNGTAPNGFNGLQLAADLEQFGPVDV